MKKTVVWTLIIAAAMLISGCNNIARYTGGESSFEKTSLPFEMKAAAPAELGAAPMAEMPYPSERKIIKTIYLSIETKDIDAASEAMSKIVATLGGFVADSRSYEDDAGRRMMSMKFRVPVAELDRATAEIKGLGRIREENITGDDVTEEYVDLEARLRNAKTLEERLLNILEQKSTRLKDVLDTERELASVREKIESLEGRKKFMDDRLELATISIDLAEPPGFGRGIFDPLRGLIQRTLGAFTSSLALLVVVACAAVPWIVTIIVLGWLFLQLLRIWVRRRREIRAQKQRESNGR